MWGARSACGPPSLTLAPAAHVVAVSAVTHTSPAPVIENVSPTPDASLDEPASGHIGPRTL